MKLAPGVVPGARVFRTAAAKGGRRVAPAAKAGARIADIGLTSAPEGKRQS